MMKVEIRNLGQTDFRAISGGEEITLSPGDHCILTVHSDIAVSESAPAALETAATATVAHEIPSLPDSDNVEHDEPEVNHES